jgi:hypothetical protein
MKKLLLFLFATLGFANIGSAQSVRIKWKQIATGTNGQVAIVGVDGNGAWVTPPFLKLSDTTAMLAAYKTRIQTLEAGLVLKEDVANKSTSTTLGTSNTLYPTQNAVKTYVDGQVTTVNTSMGNYLLKSGGTMTGAIVLAADPTTAMNPATKQYVDNIASGLTWKQAVDAATTTNVTIASPGVTMIDGVTLVSGTSRVLVKNQTTAAENGIYLYRGSGSGMTRTAEMDTWAEVPGSAVFVKNGDANGKVGFVVGGVPESGTIGSQAIPWTQFTGAGQLSATTPIVLTGNVISHATSGVTAGTYNSVTVNSTGHVTGASNTTVVTAESDPVFTASPAGTITSTNKTDWTAGYNDKVNSVSVTGTGTKTVTLTQQDGGIVTTTFTDMVGTQYTDAAQQYTGSATTTFTLAQAPSATQHLAAYLNGVLLHAADYSVTGTTLTTTFTTESSDYLTVYYAY